MQCLPLVFNPSITIHVLWGKESIHVTVQRDENLTFSFLETEAVNLFKMYSKSARSKLKFIKGLRTPHGIFMESDANIFQICSNFPSLPSFILCGEGPVNHMINDALLRKSVSYLGFDIDLLGNTLMLVCKKWKRVFSSDDCWDDLELNFPFMGTSALSSDAAGYKQWLINDYGLPKYCALKVLNVALKSPRLKIWLGNQQHNEHMKTTTSSDGFLSWFFNTNDVRSACNLILLVSDPSASTSSKNLHKAISWQLPHSAINGGCRALTVLHDDIVYSV